uniref:Uncharacterized protein n=1 Tax=Anguilla anguilla TaxID=7936 RepID=A0A0E9PE13_ANGAN
MTFKRASNLGQCPHNSTGSMCSVPVGTVLTLHSADAPLPNQE